MQLIDALRCETTPDSYDCREDCPYLERGIIKEMVACKARKMRKDAADEIERLINDKKRTNAKNGAV